MPLTELQIKNVKPHPGKTIRLFDARGLYIEISETGGRWWRLKFRFAGKEKRLSLGVYPETSLKEARSRCDEARKLLSDGIDPSQQRKVDRLVRAERSDDGSQINCLRIPDLWNARICLPLAAPRLAKPARNQTTAPRIVDGADRAEHKSSHSMEVDQRSQRASPPEPCRRTCV
jgi:hypothetical protein